MADERKTDTQKIEVAAEDLELKPEDAVEVKGGGGKGWIPQPKGGKGW